MTCQLVPSDDGKRSWLRGFIRSADVQVSFPIMEPGLGQHDSHPTSRKFDYLTYVVVIATAALANLMFLTFWGRRVDRAGNIRVLKVTSILVPLGL